MSWDYCASDRPYAEFKDEDQFYREVAGIARLAAVNATKIDEKFSSFEAIAKYLVEEAQGSERMRRSWFGYYAGAAAGILGNLEEAEQFLRGISDKRVIPHAERFLAVVDSPTGFRLKANETLKQQRTTLKLPPLEKVPF